MNKNIEVLEPPVNQQISEKQNCDKKTVYKILDEGFICHIGFAVDEQQYVVPLPYMRIGENLIIHGSQENLMMRALSWEIDVCVTVTLIDGPVLARSAFNHTVNYRCVMIFGKAKYIADERRKSEILRLFAEKIIPNRPITVRPPNDSELKSTTVLTLSLDDGSTKICCAEPLEKDHAREVWAGIIPFEMTIR